jgi:hypothetical protein
VLASVSQATTATIEREIMITRARTVAFCLCVCGLCVSPSVASGGDDAAVPSVTGIWLAYVPANLQTADWTIVLRNNPRSTRITGNYGEFNVVGTISPASGQALLQVGLQPGTTQTDNLNVKFVFKSNSTAQSNHPTFSGTLEIVRRATGEVVPNSQEKVRALRCSSQTNAKAAALCG